MLNFTKEKIAVFFILTLLLFQSGCKRKNVAYDSRLVAAERLMEEHPDSAMMILDTISTGAFDSAADRAFYNLLLTQARYKNYQEFTSDSIIASAVDFYRDSQDSELLMRALYYHVVVARQLGRSDSDIVDDVFRAEEIARSLDSPLWIARTNDLLADIFYEGYCYDDALGYIDTAAANYDKAQRRMEKLYALSQKAAILSHRKLQSGSCNLLDSIMSECGTTEEDSMLLAYCQKVAIQSLLYDGNIEKACDRLELFNSYGRTDLLTAKDCARFAELGMRSRNLTMTLYWLDKGLGMIKNSEDKECIYLSKAYIDAITGDFESGFNYLHEILEIQTAKINEFNKNSPLISMRDYYDSKASEANRRAYRMKLIIIGILIFVAVVIAVGLKLHSLRIKVKNLEILQSINEIRSLSETISKYEQYKLKSETIGVTGEMLYHEKFRLISFIGDEYYETQNIPGKDIKPIHRLGKKEIEMLKDSQTIVKIEELVNLYKDNVMARLREQIPTLKDGNCRLAIMVFAGLSLRTISLVYGIPLQSVSNKVQRLRNKITEINPPDKENFLENLRIKKYLLRDLL